MLIFVATGFWIHKGSSSFSFQITVPFIGDKHICVYTFDILLVF